VHGLLALFGYEKPLLAIVAATLAISLELTVAPVVVLVAAVALVQMVRTTGIRRAFPAVGVAVVLLAAANGYWLTSTADAASTLATQAAKSYPRFPLLQQVGELWAGTRMTWDSTPYGSLTFWAGGVVPFLALVLALAVCIIACPSARSAGAFCLAACLSTCSPRSSTAGISSR
jgi:hypothetical protein